ncbi:XRE family transcriptional regulator [Sphingopyxis lindanitolerans]|uniref:XRE family transcriptional regulator n=1 Tax=Sphingopyxis lindanitolerans TaxID=2054227 RepID=A0A2S8B9K0_9SPHN|nr:helix-turn-helix domain-containing protein [Sphingopyxis lindanitolerans]PQM29027.1 XRE family transcriptional regulator [Sphingopyxis lindanitolerans]
MAIPGYFHPAAPGADARARARRTLRLPAQGTHDDGSGIAVLVHNISETGLLLESDAGIAVGDRIEIDLPHAGESPATVVWVSDRLSGCRFDTPISPATLSAAQLRSAVTHDAHDDEAAASPADPAFGSRLQRLRAQAGLNQAQVAERMGVSAPSVSGWEKGRARPKHSRMAALAAILGVPTSELLGDHPPEALQDLIERSRAQIAMMVGTSADKVRIIVEL